MLTMLKAIYWFKRDLRVDDNRALNEAVALADRIIPIFIIDEGLLKDLNIDREDLRLSFIISALRRLSRQVKLYVFYGKTVEVFEYLLGKYKIDYVITAKPLTWSGRSRCEQVKNICDMMGVRYHEVSDNILVEIGKIRNLHNFSSFYRAWLRMVDTRISPPPPLDKVEEIDEPDIIQVSEKIKPIPCRFWDVDILMQDILSYNFRDYERLRDNLGEDYSSKVSPCLRMGLISIRRLYELSYKDSPSYIRQLAWREYYYNLVYRYPYMKDLELKPWARRIEWENDKDLLERFMRGETGYPIIDAGIRELKVRKWAHNRARLLMANFLTKDLFIDWRIGEKFFKHHLIDYDEVLNVGNWQWASSVGVDNLPLRIFNPITQAKEYDPECKYIKRYIPELSGYSCEELHDPLKYRLRDYFEPIVDHYERVRKFKEMVSKLIKSK